MRVVPIVPAAGLAAALLVSLVALSPTARGDDEKTAPARWGGLIKEKALPKLEGSADAKAGGSTFAIGAFTNAEAWAAFAKDAGGLPDKPTIDWTRQAIVYVVLRANTNDLAFGAWAPPGKDGVASLAVKWRMIEPFYMGQVPAVFHTVDRAGLKKVTIAVDDGGAARPKELGSVSIGD